MSASAVARRSGISPEGYLRLDAGAPFKSERLRGEMDAMAGGTIDHGLIKTNITGELRSLLKGHRCRVRDSDVRIKAGASGLFAYPDAPVICGRPETTPEDPDAAGNPTLVVEVLSESTAHYDLGKKFDCRRLRKSTRAWSSRLPRRRARRPKNRLAWEA